MLVVRMGLINPAEFAALAKAERESWWHRGMRRTLFRLLDPLVAGRSIRTVLDAGWGTGYFARLLQGRYDWRVFPLTVGWEGQAGVERMVRAELPRLAFADGSFDAVFLVDLLAHFPKGQEDAVVRECVRVLAPGGLIVLRAAAHEIFWSRHSEYMGERQRFTRAQLIASLERCDIRMLRSSYVNALLSPAALIRSGIWERLMRQAPANPFARVPTWLDSLLYAPLALESYWLGAGLNFPFGQTLLLIGEKSAAAAVAPKPAVLAAGG